MAVTIVRPDAKKPTIIDASKLKPGDAFVGYPHAGLYLTTAGGLVSLSHPDFLVITSCRDIGIDRMVDLEIHVKEKA